ncbi:hypothetical protein CY34DRAFT_8083 [Suillus luteus UH-Slu-Lm8-n1]|uniref:Unplaced genomic scaffold CY34scaffold_5, whole genome shotgun sequence n=1 Tax=Suillus luteus UH-Slu-Lm8-n1 TaxID=930992 RepID=A0A0D0BGI6_9AGAM|nr:hypothetical protein CY34DRAFT_8083 [Suillus luteus UH-Slu-Lm8-n1]
MVDWKTPKELEAEGIVFTKAAYVLFGIYIWEICTTGKFELSIFLGRRKLAWPLVRPSLIREIVADLNGHRFSSFCAVTVNHRIIFVNVSTKIDCNALYIFTSIAGNLTISSASTSLMIRTMALWEWKRRAVLSMLALSFGQFAILIRTIMTVQASWDHHAGACQVTQVLRYISKLIQRLPAMSFDFVILVMTLFVLRKRFRHEDLSSLLCRDGLIYFLITSTCNTVPAVLAALNLNNEMNVIAIVPAAAVSAIAACRVFIRLDAYNKGNGEKVHNNPSLVNHNSTTPSVSLGSPSSSADPVSFLPLPSPDTTKPRIRATMGTTDLFGLSQSAKSKSPYERDSDRTLVDSESDPAPRGNRRLTARISQYIHFGSAV